MCTTLYTWKESQTWREKDIDILVMPILVMPRQVGERPDVSLMLVVFSRVVVVLVVLVAVGCGGSGAWSTKHNICLVMTVWNEKVILLAKCPLSGAGDLGDLGDLGDVYTPGADYGRYYAREQTPTGFPNWEDSTTFPALFLRVCVCVKAWHVGQQALGRICSSLFLSSPTSWATAATCTLPPTLSASPPLPLSLSPWINPLCLQ